MTVLSSHTTHGLSDEELASGDFTEASKWWDQCIAAHKEAGMEYIVTPYLSCLLYTSHLTTSNEGIPTTDAALCVALQEIYRLGNRAQCTVCLLYTSGK